MTSKTDILIRHDNNGITTLTLNRPDKFNALSSELMTAVQSELDDIAMDKSVRVVIIKGNGKAFSAGHDLAELMQDPSETAMRALFRQCSNMMMSITRLPQPVIACVHGVAAAAGCQMVAQCDLAIAADHVKFGTSGVNLGLFCSTPMVAVTRNLGRKQAMEMLLTGDMIDAGKALQMGLLNEIVPLAELEQAADNLAHRVARQSMAAIRLGKELFYKQIEQGLEAAYDMAAEVITCNMQTKDALEGIQAFLDKQPMPPWKDE